MVSTVMSLRSTTDTTVVAPAPARRQGSALRARSHRAPRSGTQRKVEPLTPPQRRVGGPVRRPDRFDRSVAAEKRRERDRGFEARQARTEAEVDAVPEREMPDV